MVYDAADGYVLLFSGAGSIADTWAFSNGNWTEMNPPVSPPQRTYAGMAYDYKDGYVVMFGGHHSNTTTGYLNDTWTYRGGVWTNITSQSPTRPHARYGMAMAFEPAEGYVVLFGGNFGNLPGETIGDTWTFAGGIWSNVTGSLKTSPCLRAFDGMAYDSHDGYLLLFGGWTPNKVLNDTWELRDGVWTNITASLKTAPPPRWYSLVTNGTGGSVLLFGGIQGVVKADDSASQDTWSYANGQWTNLTAQPITAANTPSKRFGSGFAFNSKEGDAVLFGGLAGTLLHEPILGDTWTFANDNWTNTTAAYLVTFSESGLPKGTTWNVTIDLTAISSNSGTLRFDLPNGTYDYTVGAIPGYSTTGQGLFSIDGKVVTLSVSFHLVKYTIPFTETGLPAHSLWTVTLAPGGNLSSTTTSVQFSEPNGTYNYSITPVAGYHITTGSYTGSVIVAGASPATIALAWTQVKYRVTFTETGLYKTVWNVTVGATTVSSTSSTHVFNLANGTYSFAVTSSDTAYAPSYTPTLIVNGGPASATVNFTVFTQRVTFTESELLAGDTWYVNISGGPSLSGTGTSMATSLVNGSYSFRAASSDTRYGPSYLPTFMLNGAPVSVGVNFTLYSYTMTLKETRLPSGTSWSVTVNSVTYTSTTDRITFQGANGTYDYQIGLVSGYHTADLGTLTVAGSAVARSVPFSLTTYIVKFSATGLTSKWDTGWCVTFNATNAKPESVCSTTATILFSGTVNGTYGYTIGAVKNYSLGASYMGTITVAGGGQGATANTVNVPWTLVKYTVTFTETGLPSGTSWSVTIDSQTKSGKATSLSFSLPNGTYSFTVTSAGYTDLSIPTSPLTVNGTAVSVKVTFT